MTARNRFTALLRASLIPLAAFALTLFSINVAHAELVGLWRFEGDASDSSMSANHGTFVNGASLDPEVPAALGAASSQSLFLSGVTRHTQHVLVPHHDSLNITRDMTIAAWVMPEGNLEWDGVIAKNPSDGSGNNHAGNFELRIENGSRVLNLLWQSGAANDTTGTTCCGGTVLEGAWTHVAVTTDGTNSRFYVNGSLVGTNLAPAVLFPNTNPLFIGSRNDLFTPMNGHLDDVALFNEVLSEAQIGTIMGGDFSEHIIPEPSSLVLAALGLLGVLSLRRRRTSK